MPLIALLLALQNPQGYPAEPPRRDFELDFGPIAEYWFPKFKGNMRVDGTTSSGTNL
ncbi:MAG: hypothetical protein HY293_05710, partial [Planctomycetes bacterium]|nr:hypothetical protein [Planctomycetota bacterium]